jgi:subtilisin family serine protease
VRLLLAAAAAGALACAGAAHASSEPTAPIPAVPPGPVAWVVGADHAAASVELAAALADAGAAVERLPHLDAIAVTGGSPEEVADALAQEGGAEYVEPQLPRSLHGEPGDAVDPLTGRPYAWALAVVRAADGLAAAGGGAPSSPVAVVDSGVDRAHPDLAGRVTAGRDVLGGGAVDDLVGHGTFVAGLISAIDDNGAGGRGIAGATPIVPVRVTNGTGITSADLAAGIVAAVDSGARVVNVSIGGQGLAAVERAALDYARRRDVLIVASAGNSALQGNPLEYPAAAIGGDAGGWSAGLSVAATDPLGRPAPFSTHNRHVSIAAPGTGMGRCDDGVYSTIPSAPASMWSGDPCDMIFSGAGHGAGRYAYGQGTSFSAPLVAGAAALVRQAGPALRADQVADVLRRTASQTFGSGWNQHTGAGVLDVAAAVAMAARYDTSAPALAFAAEPRAGSVRVRASADEVAGAGKEPAGGIVVRVEKSHDGAAWAPLAPPSASPIDAVAAAGAGRPLWLRATACDRNRNCATRASGPHTGAGGPGARGAGLRGSILGLGLSRPCPPGRASCLRLVVRAAPAAAGRTRFSLEVRQPGRGRPVATATGALRAGRPRALRLAPRAPLACGRLVARLTVRARGRVHTSTRRAPVRRCRLSVSVRAG